MVNMAEPAKEDLKDFELPVREKVIDLVEKYLDSGVDNEKVEYVRKPDIGLKFHRLKLKEKGLDHRVYFIFRKGIHVIAVRHRDFAYSEEDLEEIDERLSE